MGRKKKTHEEYVAELAIKNPNVEVIGQYIGACVKILHRCKIHDIEWMAYPDNILHGHGCYMCGNNIKKTQEQYIQEVKVINSFIEVIEQYIDALTPIQHRCKVDGYIWYATPSAILRGDKCPKCMGNAKKTTNQYIDELKTINDKIEVIGKYINATTPIAHRCMIDGHIWNAKPVNLLSGKGCPICKFNKLSNLFVKSHEQYIKEVALINPDIEVLGQYINARTPILHHCIKDDYIWKSTPFNVLNGQGCPRCQESNGERQIRQWLENKSITYVYQKTFMYCKDKKELPFDFYLPDYNICIEYDGEQHFQPIDFAGNGDEWAIERFNATQQHDGIKNQYCKDNDIDLLRIPYYANIGEELEKFFIHLI